MEPGNNKAKNRNQGFIQDFEFGVGSKFGVDTEGVL